MKGELVFDFIKKLTPEEMDELGLFVQSPFHNRGTIAEQTIVYYNILKEHYPDFESDQLLPEAISATIFPEKSFNSWRIDRIQANLLNLIREFIGIFYVEKKQWDHIRMMSQARFHRAKKSFKRYELTIKNIYDSKEERTNRDKQYYLDLYDISCEKLLAVDLLYPKNKTLIEVLLNLDSYYILARLEYSIMLIYMKTTKTFDADDTLSILPNLLEIAESSQLKEISLVNFYRSSLTFLQNIENASQDEFNDFKSLVDLNRDKLDPEMQYIMHVFLRSYYTTQYNNGNKESAKKMFDLVVEHLESGMIYTDGGLYPTSFSNIVNAGLKNKEYTWVKNFLETNKDKIIVSLYPLETYQLNLSLYYFSIRKFDMAEKCLSMQFNEPVNKLIARNLEIKIYYELSHSANNSKNSYIIILQAKIDSYKNYIFEKNRKKEFQPIYIERANQFIDIIKGIVNTAQGNQKRIEKLRQRILKTKSITEREWLLEKLDELS